VTVGLVVPCFNEAERWSAPYWAEILQITDLHLLFVDDGSSDATRALAEEAVAGTTSQVISLPANAGKAEAVRAGMQRLLASHSDTEAETFTAVGYLDADGAFNREDIEDLIEAYRHKVLTEDFQAAWSSRVALAGRDIARSGSRHYIGRLVATFVSLGYGQIPYDTQSGYKLFQPSERLEACLAEPFRTRWLFELELLARWRALFGSALRVWEEPLQYWHDVPGSKINGRESMRVMKELIAVKREQRKPRSTRL
jgi:glycosyltransferase involved in cell wall biosynthesis